MNNTNHNLTFVVLLIGAVMVTACAYSQMRSLDTRHSNPDKNQALLQASYRAQKKYDLLEKELQVQYNKSKERKMLIGHLFSAIDLAEFYTYGFINYKKSLEFYAEADLLNKQVKRSGKTSDTDEGTAVTYYQASGKYIIPRKYDPEKVSSQILLGRKRIGRIFKHQTDGQASSFELPQIRPLVTDHYGFAIRVERDVLSPAYFDQFEEKLTKAAQDHFQRRHKLPQSERDYYIAFNILRGLTTVFDFSSLSEHQIRKIYYYIENTRKAENETGNELQDAYLDFVEVLCLAQLGEYKKALFSLENFQRQLDKINLELNSYLESLKTSRNAAVASATVKTIGFLALSVLTMGSGSGFYIDLSPVGFDEFGASVITLQRQINVTGESDYAKNWSILLDIDDQLQLFRAAGQSYHETGNLEKSIELNREAVQIIASLRSTITTEEGRISFAAYKEQVYSYLIEDLFRSGKQDEAFYYSENSRARSLVDLLGSKVDLSFGAKQTNVFADKVKDIQIYRDQLRGNVAISDQQIAYIKRLEEELDQEMNSTAENPGKNKKVLYKELLSLITVTNIDYSEVQKILPKNSTLIEYYIADNNVYVWILDKESFLTVSIDANRESVKEKVLHLVQTIKSGPDVEQNDLKRDSKEVYDLIFKPLERHIKNKSVYLVSHEFLHFLPFDALFTGQNYLVEKYAFSSLPSASLLQFLEPVDSVEKSLLVFGNPTLPQAMNYTDLPGAEKEARSISAFFATKEVLVGEKATETNFRSKSSRATITHIAGHGLFDEQDALNSRLFLAEDNQNDGLLTAKELYGIPKVSALVVLSACETARTEIGRGDELLGLMRGFFFSGTSSLVASLWIVEDTGALQLMKRFYNHMIKENQPPVIALQKAKQDMIDIKKYQAPFYWSSFNLYGLGI